MEELEWSTSHRATAAEVLSRGLHAEAEALALALDVVALDDFGIAQGDELNWRVLLYDDVRALVGDGVIEPLANWLLTQPEIKDAWPLDHEVLEVATALAPVPLAAKVCTFLGRRGRTDTAP